MLNGCSASRLSTNNICNVLITKEKLSTSGQKELTLPLAKYILVQDEIYKEFCGDKVHVSGT